MSCVTTEEDDILADASNTAAVVSPPGDLSRAEIERFLAERTRMLQDRIEDLEEQVRVLQSAERTPFLLAEIFRHSLSAIFVCDADAAIIAVNQAFTDLTGYEAGDVVGKTPKVLQSGRHDRTFYERMWNSIQREGRWQGEIWNRKKSGEIYCERLSVSVVRDGSGAIQYYIAIFDDRTEQWETESRIRHLAEHDALTNLPNRLVLDDRLHMALAHARRANERIGIMFIDLDRFKPINDTLGHPVGDELLRDVAERLRQSVRASDTVARYGGDEFVALLPDVRATGDLAHIATKILEAVSAPFPIEEHAVEITVSIGIVMYPGDGETATTLLRNADNALFAAKQAGRNQYRFFEASMARDD